MMSEVLGFTPTLMERKVESLNFAEQRRAELARALAINPKLVLLDEPAAGQTEEEVENFAGILRKARETGTTILIVEHNVEFVREIADKITVLDHGAVLAEGAGDVFSDQRVVDAYMGARKGAQESVENKKPGDD
jgi:ABC-type branched-subunit amino acid transport system ATPase component